MRTPLWQFAEDKVCRDLIRRGHLIVGRNVRHIGFEIDILSYQARNLIAVEVKYRNEDCRTLDQEQRLLPHSKLKSLYRGVNHMLGRLHFDIDSIRFDLAIVTFDKRHDTLRLSYRENIGSENDLSFD